MKFFSKRVIASFVASLCLYNSEPFVHYGYTAHAANEFTQSDFINYSNAMGYPNATIIRETPFSSKQQNERSTLHQPEDISDTSDEECYNCLNEDPIEEETQPLYSVIQALPQQFSTFSSIRKNSLVYVDKTAYLVHFVDENGMLYFLTRPRRFGKTTLLHTLEHLFQGNETLFEGTAIHEKGNAGNGNWVEHPVIRIDFSSFNPSESMEYYQKKLCTEMELVGQEYGIAIGCHYDIDVLIRKLHLKFGKPVIVLVDEYDSILNNIHKRKDMSATVTVEFMSTFFRAIKGCITSLKFALVIGISRYALNSLSSGPNNFEDLTFHPNYTTLFGFTKEEILLNFDKHIEHFARSKRMNSSQIMERLDFWYDGYLFSETGENLKRVYNPISVIQCFNKQQFLPYWSSTGLSNIIISKIYASSPTFNPFKNITIDAASISHTYDPEFAIPIHYLMLDNGYLTVSGVEGDKLQLNIPNKEIKLHLKFRLDTYIPTKKCFLENVLDSVMSLRNELEKVNITSAVNILNGLCFPTYKHPLDEAAIEREVTRRMLFIFGNIIEHEYCQLDGVYPILMNTKLDPWSKLAIEAGKKHKAIKSKLMKQTCGDLDIVVKGKVNYAIEIKCGDVAESIKQILRYFMNYFTVIADILDNLPIHYLLVLNFNKGKNTKITDWILIPCDKGFIDINNTIASSSPLIDTTLKKFNGIKQEMRKFHGRNAGNEHDNVSQ